MASLKRSSDGLSKAWEVRTSLKPFFNGGKVSTLQNDRYIACLFNEKLSLVDWQKGEVMTNVFNAMSTDVDEAGADSSAAGAQPQQPVVGDSIQEGIACLCVHPNGKEMVLATANYVLKHVQIESIGGQGVHSDHHNNSNENSGGNSNGCVMHVVRTIRGHQMPVLCMAYDASGTLLATGSSDRVVRVFDVAKGYCTHTFRAHTDIVQSVRFLTWSGAGVGTGTEDTIEVISCSDDRTVQVHDLQQNKQVACLKDHMATATAVAVRHSFPVPGCGIVASCGRDSVVNLYLVQRAAARGNSYKHLKTVPFKQEELESVVFLSDDAQTGGKISAAVTASATMVVGGTNGVIKVVKLLITRPSRGADWSVDCQLLQQQPVATPPATARLQEATAPPASIVDLLHMPAHGKLAAIMSDFNVHFYSSTASASATKPTLQADELQLAGNLDDILDVVVLPGAPPAGRADMHMAVVTNSSVLRLMNSAFQTVQTLNEHEDIILAIDSSADSKYLATSSKDKTCRVWLRNGVEGEEGASDSSAPFGYSPYAVGVGHADAIGAVCISQRGATYQAKQAFVATGGADLVLKRWALPPVGSKKAVSSSAAPLQLVNTHSVRAHDKDINTIASAPNDSLLATGSQDKKVKLWKASDLSPVAVLSGHKRGVWKVTFSPVDRCLLSASGDRTVRLWSLQDHSCIRTFQGHNSSVLSAKFINAGMQLFSAGADGVLKLWTIRTGECEATYATAHSDRIWCVAALPPSAGASSGAGAAASRDSIITAGTDSSVLIWEDVTAAVEEAALKQTEERLLAEQGLMNDLRNKNFDKALFAALELNHSSKVYHILLSILESDDEVDKGEDVGAAIGDGALLDLSRQVAAGWEKTLLLNQMVMCVTGTGTGADGSSTGLTRTASYKLDRYLRRILLRGTAKQTDAVGKPRTVFTDEDDEEVELSAGSTSQRSKAPTARPVIHATLLKVLRYVHEWNTNATYAYVCHMVLDSLMRTVDLAAYLQPVYAGAGASAGAGDSDFGVVRSVLQQLLPSMLAYSERHYQRLNRLNQASYIVDYMCGSMSSSSVGGGMQMLSSRGTALGAEATRAADQDQSRVGNGSGRKSKWADDGHLGMDLGEREDEPEVDLMQVFGGASERGSKKQRVEEVAVELVTPAAKTPEAKHKSSVDSGIQSASGKKRKSAKKKLREQE